MERFCAWLSREADRQVPPWLVALGTVGTLPTVFAAVATVGAGTATQEATALLLGALGATVASWIPLAVHGYRGRKEVRVAARGFAGSVDHWRGMLRAHAAELEEAALDLEQIEGLARRASRSPAG